MAKPMGFLGGGFDYSKAAEDEFNDWYDTEHIPERLRIKGFINAVRWIGVENPKISLAIYDLESLDVLNKPEYRAVSPENFSPWSKRILLGKCTRLCRFTCEQMAPGDKVAPGDAGGLLVFALNVSEQAEAELNEWYDTEHLPALKAIPGMLCARRFRSVGGAIHKYVAVYHLASPEVCQSETWRKAAITPWAHRILAHTSDWLRLVLQCYVRTG
jgi:hypothetical protein